VTEATQDALAQCNAAIAALTTQLGNANQAVSDAEVTRDEIAARLQSEQDLKATLEASLP
jgi:chromosome segregation ATPase